MAIGWCSNLLEQGKLILSVILLLSLYAGLSMIAMFALNQGMSHYILVSYRMTIATAIIAPFAIVLDRKSRPEKTFSILAKTMLLSLFDPVLDQNLYYIEMKYTNASFTSAMCNMILVFAFLIARIFRPEKVDTRKIHCQANLAGTIVTVRGAMVMTLTKGPELNLPWTRSGNRHPSPSQSENAANQQQDFIKGALALTAAACFCCSCFIILQDYWCDSHLWRLTYGSMGKEPGPIYILCVRQRYRNAKQSRDSYSE
ncbi:WAT1-related protein At2g39510 [Ziziphus jujuba]|uniref:WAT1-related protein n=1 Tax=Ziziphus jujuba TaxID=326968 RepID=A0ABM3IEP1_ZIZJJ|nr:WAT1-related protein At2g39510 [Ziziphus jujuba]